MDSLTNEFVYRSAKGNAITNSVIVARAFGKRHQHVCRAIKNLTAQNWAACGNWVYETTYKDERGNTQPMFVMNRDGFTLLVMGFTGERATKFKIQFIQQFNKMEKYIEEQKQLQLGQQFDIPTTYSEALYRAADIARKYEQLQLESAEQKKQIEENEGYVLFGKACETSTDSILIRDFAKICCQAGIQTGEKRLFKWFRDNGWLYKSGSDKNLPTQRAKDMGLFEIKCSNKMDNDGSVRVFATAKITVKGQQYFLKLFINLKNTTD